MKTIKESVIKIILKIPINIREKVYYLNALTAPNKIFKFWKNQNRYKELYLDSVETDLEKKNFYIWQKAFFKYVLTSPKNIDIAEEFYKCRFEFVTQNYSINNKNHIILICVVKDDLTRLKMLFKHYREIGVEHFVIIDNNSSDGSLEWLKTQNDADIYLMKDFYTTNRRQAWINKLINKYGFNQWYLVIDSDELLMYQDMELKDINSLIRFAKKNNIIRLRSILIDVYSKNKLFNNEFETEESIKEQYSYFDQDGYSLKDNPYFLCQTGGVRKRIFSDENEVCAPYLTKYPLIYFKKGDIQCNSHFSYPYFHNFKSECYTALFHYKFLSKDLEKYKKVAEQGNYANGSKEYKRYIKIFNENPNCTLINNRSIKYKNSKDLENIKVIKKIEWSAYE